LTVTAALGVATGLRNSHLRAENPGVGALPSRAVAELPSEFAEVLARAQGGSPSDCRWLYESLAGRVAGYLRVHGSRDPDDLTSEVFLRVFDHLRDFEGTEAGFRSWVFTIAHRLLIDEHRQREARVETVELSEPVHESVAGGDAEADALASIGTRGVSEVLDQLAPDQRDVLTLRVVADLTVDQVAEVLGKSPGAVKSLHRRAVAALRRRLEEATP
jgi:RNA polymerase sigma-70 factor (ECF subfamily)